MLKARAVARKVLPANLICQGILIHSTCDRKPEVPVRRGDAMRCCCGMEESEEDAEILRGTMRRNSRLLHERLPGSITVV